MTHSPDEIKQAIKTIETKSDGSGTNKDAREKASKVLRKSAAELRLLAEFKGGRVYDALVKRSTELREIASKS